MTQHFQNKDSCLDGINFFLPFWTTLHRICTLNNIDIYNLLKLLLNIKLLNYCSLVIISGHQVIELCIFIMKYLVLLNISINHYNIILLKYKV